MTEYKIRVWVDGILDGPVFIWKSDKPLGGMREAGSYCLLTYSLEESVKEMVEEVSEQTKPEDSIDFVVEFGSVYTHATLIEQEKEVIKAWERLESEGYPRIAESQKKVLLDLVKKHYKGKIKEPEQ